MQWMTKAGMMIGGDHLEEDAAATFLAFSPEERAVEAAASEFLEHCIPIERIHKGAVDLDPIILAEIGEMGWFGLALAPSSGGSGLGAVELALFFREVGRRCGPMDLLAQTLGAIVAQEDDELRQQLTTGGRPIGLALVEGNELRLLGAPSATRAVLVTPEYARIVQIREERAERVPSLDAATTMRRLSDIPECRIHVQGEAAWILGGIATAAMLVGIAEAALDQIVDYAKIRETFGRKIGSYQAVRHPCADMALRVEAARCQLWYAAASVKARKADAAVQVDAAKHLANEAAVANADSNIQLHGGIGITDEHHAHLYLKRSLLLRQLFGTRRTLLMRLLHSRVED